jgi:thioredoxin-like negative regulator of GroEL
MSSTPGKVHEWQGEFAAAGNMADQAVALTVHVCHVIDRAQALHALGGIIPADRQTRHTEPHRL